MTIEFKLEKGTLKEPIKFLSFDSYYRYITDKGKIKKSLEEMYADSDLMNLIVFKVIDGLRENPAYDSSRYVAVKFDNVAIADQFKHWDFSRYNNAMEFYIDPELNFVVLVIYTPKERF